MKPTIQLYDNETIEFELQPQPRYATYNFLRGIFLILIITVILAMFFTHSKNISMDDIKQFYLFCLSGGYTTVVGIILTILVLGLFIKEKVTTKNQWYFFTNQRCIIYCGLWTTNKNFLPYSKIVDISLRQNGSRKIFNLYAIVIVCSGAAAIIDGLSSGDAEKISKFLSTKMQNKNQ